MNTARAVAALYSESSGAGDARGGGADEPLVLLHGWGMNLRVFDGLRAALSAQHRVTTIPAYGASPDVCIPSQRKGCMRSAAPASHSESRARC